MGKFSVIEAYNSSFQQTFNTDNQSLADHLKQAEDQRKQRANPSAKPTPAQPPKQTTEQQAANKVQSAIVTATAAAAAAGGITTFDITKGRYTSTTTNDVTTFFVQANEKLTDQNLQESRKAQEELYKAVSANKKVVLTVLGVPNYFNGLQVNLNGK